MTKKANETDVIFIQALAELLSAQDLTEIEVNRNYGEDDSLNVRISKTLYVIQMAATPSRIATPASSSAAGAPSAAVPEATEDPASHPGAVASPMVGTVYMQSAPGTPAFIAVVSLLYEGYTILIIEAMKTMNQIPAPHGGTVKRILVEDGAPVEYGAPMVIIE